MESGREPRSRRRGRLRTRWPGRWYELSLVVASSCEDDVVEALCADAGLGATCRPSGRGRIRVCAWFEEREAAIEAVRRLEGLVAAPAAAEALIREVSDPGWLEAGLARREPVRAGRFAVLDTDEPPRGRHATGEVPVAIPAGRAFGTGEHETTSLCLELLDRHLGPGVRRVLDLGTGSGILAIAAALAGVPQVLALDSDPDVLEVARENVDLNGVVGRVEVARGTVSSVGRVAPFDLVVSNIHRTALVRGARALTRALVPHGVAILSGFPDDDAETVADAWRTSGAEIIERASRGEWCALALRRASADAAGRG